MGACMCARMCVCVYACVHMCMCVCVCMDMCMCACVCVCCACSCMYHSSQLKASHLHKHTCVHRGGRGRRLACPSTPHTPRSAHMSTADDHC